MKISESSRYQQAFKVFVKGDRKKAEALKKTLTLLKHNPRHPGLHSEKLKNSELWTVRIDRGNRLFFIWKDKSVIVLVDVGKHDKYKKY